MCSKGYFSKDFKPMLPCQHPRFEIKVQLELTNAEICTNILSTETNGLPCLLHLVLKSPLLQTISDNDQLAVRQRCIIFTHPNLLYIELDLRANNSL